MKTKLSLLSLAVCAAFSLAAQAQAQNGQITFTGEIVSSNCTVNVSSTGPGSTSGQNATVGLPTADLGALSAAGNRTAPSDFSIALTGCTNTTNNVWTYFDAPLIIANGNGRINNGTGTSTNVSFQVTNTSDVQINLGGGATGPGNGPNPSLATGAATLPYRVWYYAENASATAGTMSSVVNYSLIFN